MTTIKEYINEADNSIIYFSFGIAKGLFLTMPIAFIAANFEYFKAISNFLIYSI